MIRINNYSRKFTTRYMATHAASSSEIPKVPNFINGKFVQSKTDKWIDVVNPATQEIVCRVPQSTQEELCEAEEGAIKAFQTWKEVPVQQRQVCLL